MFKLVKSSKLRDYENRIDELESRILDLQQTKRQLQEKAVDLERTLMSRVDELSNLKKNPIKLFEDGEESKIVFSVDKDLNVKTKTAVSKEIIDILLNNNYISSDQMEDEFALHLAMVLIADDIVSEILSQFEDKGDNK